jgi:hypothetical protein
VLEMTKKRKQRNATTMNKKINLAWKKTTVKKMKDVKHGHFYAFSHGVRLQYIGMTYAQDVHDEIKNTIRAYGLSANGLTIWIGQIKQTDYKRVSKDLVMDIERFLIFTYQPSFNIQGKPNNNVRRNLVVKNTGCPLLSKKKSTKTMKAVKR